MAYNIFQIRAKLSSVAKIFVSIESVSAINFAIERRYANGGNEINGFR